MSLALKTIDGLAIPGKFGREELQRHHAAKPGVLRLIYDTHATATQLRKNSKMRDGLTDHNGEKNCSLRAMLGWRGWQVKQIDCKSLHSAGLSRKVYPGDLQSVSAKS
jgi:hypothetical protein